MRRAFLLSLLLLVSGCHLMEEGAPRKTRWRRFERWSPSIACYPPFQAAEGTKREKRGHLVDTDVSVFGYAPGQQLRYNLRDTSLSRILDATGGLPKFRSRGGGNLGSIHADVNLPGGEGWSFSFRNWRRRDALDVLARVSGHAIIVGADVRDTIDVEVTGAPPIVLLRLLADQGGVIIVEDQES